MNKKNIELYNRIIRSVDGAVKNRLFESDEDMNGILSSHTAEKLKNSLKGFYDDIDALTTYTDYKALCKRGYAIMENLDQLKESIEQMLEMYDPDALDKLVDAFNDWLKGFKEFYIDLDWGDENNTKDADTYYNEFAEHLEEYDLPDDWYVEFDNLIYYLNGIYDDQRTGAYASGGAIYIFTGHLKVKSNGDDQEKQDEYYRYLPKYEKEVWTEYPLVFKFKNDDLGIEHTVSLNINSDKFRKIYNTIKSCAFHDKSPGYREVWMPDLQK